MNDLISTLLNCPNLSLRLLDSKTGRSIKTLNHDQLYKVYSEQRIADNKYLRTPSVRGSATLD
ncbi:hypothetical protein MNBD_GAMMA10-791 [hydrothermal vent metagenome]|uniref:Uncharacterized protein n=1 Tax=hydrothermal vent metagenome TaxID=652676 RepID=A0A3B0XUF4_9ZZZZ